ncbi:hypothetical protein Acr_08g0018650 [Actinidia rufa]|uniref:Hydroxyproline-rich glycoprotein family protein n=1 Tax=Actinidia rufa TaxID=165716 RepID=A0A7J0F5I8_9ERIC|nr:hypothetical protein Acr_08g0018650 [Actinidia rufa]
MNLNSILLFGFLIFINLVSHGDSRQLGMPKPGEHNENELGKLVAMSLGGEMKNLPPLDNIPFVPPLPQIPIPQIPPFPFPFPLPPPIPRIHTIPVIPIPPFPKTPIFPPFPMPNIPFLTPPPA